MADDKKKHIPSKAMDLDLAAQQDFDELERAGKKGLLGRFNTKFNDALQTNRPIDRPRNPVVETAAQPHAAAADDLAMSRAKTVTMSNVSKMIIPEGVIIEGSLTGGSETEISGKIEGNVTIDGRLYLGPSALISGNVRAGSCRVDGLVEGKVECSDELDLGPTGRLNADVIAGKRINLAGQVLGNVTTPGVLKMAASSKVAGDVRTRSLIMEEGATLDGSCVMRSPAQRSNSK